MDKSWTKLYIVCVSTPALYMFPCVWARLLIVCGWAPLLGSFLLVCMSSSMQSTLFYFYFYYHYSYRCLFSKVLVSSPLLFYFCFSYSQLRSRRKRYLHMSRRRWRRESLPISWRNPLQRNEGKELEWFRRFYAICCENEYRWGCRRAEEAQRNIGGARKNSEGDM